MIQEVLARHSNKANLTRSAINFQAYLDAMEKKHKHKAKKKHRRHTTKYNRGTWNWIYHKYLQPDLTGHRRWTGGKVILLSLSKTCPPRHLPVSTERVSTPYNNISSTGQTYLIRFGTGHRIVQQMENLLQR